MLKKFTGKSKKKQSKDKIVVRKLSKNDSSDNMFVDDNVPYNAPLPLPPHFNQEAANQHQKFIAIYSYRTTQEGYLSFQKGDEMFIIDNRDEWWLAEAIKSGEKGFVPSNYVALQGGNESQDWYFGTISHIGADRLLSRHDTRRGTFLIRKSEAQIGGYSLSVLDDDPIRGKSIKHYRIKSTGEFGELYISSSKKFQNLSSLVAFYQNSPDGLCCKLTSSCYKSAQVHSLGRDVFEIDRSELTFEKKLGNGQFGEVWKGFWKKNTEVAIKTLRTGTMSEAAFLAEAEIMKRLHHENLIQLFAVVSSEPIYIITEFMSHGSLLEYLRSGDGKQTELNDHIDIALQVASGMLYLETKMYIHRDLRAANVLVGNFNLCKVSDFGLARLINDEVYQSKLDPPELFAFYRVSVSQGSAFPVKWTAPEALNYGEFSIKSDVWSFGILLTEIITKGRIPYAGMTNVEVAEKVISGYRMSKPTVFPPCPHLVYELMMKCWHENEIYRPSFGHIKEFLEEYLHPTS